LLNAKGLGPAAVTPSHRPPHRQSALQADTLQVQVLLRSVQALDEE